MAALWRQIQAPRISENSIHPQGLSPPFEISSIQGFGGAALEGVS